MAADPEQEAYEGWLLRQTNSTAGLDERAPRDAAGPVRAMALDILAE